MPSATDTWGAPSASWNRPAAELGEDGLRSADFSGRLLTWGCGFDTPPSQQGKVGLPARAWSCPVYDKTEATTKGKPTSKEVYQLNQAMNTYPFVNCSPGVVVPWGENFAPSVGNPGGNSDALAIVTDSSSGKAWELWRTNEGGWLGWWPMSWFHPFGMSAASVVAYSNLWSLTDGKTVAGSGAGINKSIGLLRLDDLERPDGPQHALAMYIAAPMFGPLDKVQAELRQELPYCRPAARLENLDGNRLRAGGVYMGPLTDAVRHKAIPSGMRFALRITDRNIATWLDAHGYAGPLRETMRKLVVCLRDFGWIIKETAGYGMRFEFEGFINVGRATQAKRLGFIDNGGPDPLAGMLDGIFSYGTVYVVNQPA